MFGESQTAVSVYFWTEGVYDPYYLSDSLEDAFEVVTINVKLPPLISGHTITRANNSETDINIIHTGDIVHFSFANSSSEIEDMDFRMDLPEAFNEGESPTESNDNSCWKYIEPNLAGVFDGSWIAPSAAEIYTHCHGDAYNQYSGDWIFDQSIARSLVISVDDIHNNSIPSYYSLTLAAQPTPAEAPPTEEPTPPKKTILEESTPQQETQPTPPAPTPPAPTPPAPTPPAPTPPAPSPSVKPSPTPTPTPSVKPSPTPTATPTPSVKPSPSPTQSASPTPSPTVKPTPTATPTPAPSVKPSPSPTQSASPTPKASSSPAPKPLEITPPKSGADTTKSSVSVQNLVPGQKIKVTIVEGKSLPSTQPTKTAGPQAKPSPLPSINNFKVTTKGPVTVAPKPSGSSAGVGIKNLKPGQKIKVTIKTGGTKK